MNIRKRALILNGAIIVTILVELFYHSIMIVGISALVLLVLVNVALFIRAKWERRKGKD